MRRAHLVVLASTLAFGSPLSAQVTMRRPPLPVTQLLGPLIPDSLAARWRATGILPATSAAQMLVAVRAALPKPSVECRMPVARLDSAGASAALKRDTMLIARARDPMAIIVPPNTCLKL